jgi:hypothetical protein
MEMGNAISGGFSDIVTCARGLIEVCGEDERRPGQIGVVTMSVLAQIGRTRPGVAMSASDPSGHTNRRQMMSLHL